MEYKESFCWKYILILL